MFIGLTGPSCSGKHAIARYLCNTHGYNLLALENHTHAHCELYQTAKAFRTVHELITYVTERWREKFVICDMGCDGIWELKKRPFFLHVSVEAPLYVRYQRRLSRDKVDMTLEEFVREDDMAMFHQNGDTSSPLYTVLPHSDVTITNISDNWKDLVNTIEQVQLLNPERLRPSWDTYFMHLSDLAARRSNCMKRRVGCILVKDSRVIATGYNGTPRGLKNCNEGGCKRCNDGAPCGTGLDRCLCMHAEENALLEAGRGRVDFSSGVVLYCNTCPCLGCAIKIIQQGVKEVVYAKSYGMDEMTARVFAEANVTLRQHSPLSMRLGMMDASMPDVK
ncbi:Deoxycytidine monophosphate (dCMP) deaminase [Apophysomyces ossiformis]|uniref:Deoxycytidylate deaminase n=1 Tax=Apophysomyces ossiformis TaxID=679940 RepID=A0A8H7BZ27_9FUNG|nr:Deoxycytidine monophosphate (dCMP) deaminase [Apophysomyces ossiformis]